MQSTKQRIPTVSYLENGTIVELLYDSATRRTAFALVRESNVQIVDELETQRGELLVPYPPTNNLIRHGCIVLPSQPVEHGTKAELLHDIEAYLHRYVELPPLFERIAAHYALLTWVHDAFNELPYLRFKGDYGSGKTRALLALGNIAYRGFFASGASTVSPVFHTLDAFGGTLVLDEADLRFSGKTADLVKILNNGNVKGLPVLRTIQNRHKEFNPAAFHVFGPKIVAMRGAFRDPALESRFITAEMSVHPLRDGIPIQLPAALHEEARDLRNRLLHFRLTNRFDVASAPERAVPGLDPRLNQTALSLLSLVEDSVLRAQIAELLRDRQVELARLRVEDLRPKVIAALEEKFRESSRNVVPLNELAARISQTTGREVSPRYIGQALRELGIPIVKSHGTAAVARRSVARSDSECRPAIGSA